MKSGGKVCQTCKCQNAWDAWEKEFFLPHATFEGVEVIIFYALNMLYCEKIP